MEGLPTPPHEEFRKHLALKRSSGSSKSSKSAHGHRAAKRQSIHHAQPPSPIHDSQSAADGRNKRVWKACERCRMKKTKCDGEFPCKRCKDDGLVCTAGTRKKMEYKQLPKGYAEVLENTQFALIATVHKLYSMVRNGQHWDLGEPEINDRGQPIIHNIASRLGCIRPNSDIDLPVHSVFPEDEAGLAELARQLEEQQSSFVETSEPPTKRLPQHHSPDSSSSDRASSAELEHSDFEHDYRQRVLGGLDPMALSPQSLTFNEFDGAEPVAAPIPTANVPRTNTMPPSLAYAPWLSKPSAAAAALEMTQRYITTGSYMDLDMFNQGLLESNFGTIKPHVLSCPNPEVMMGVGDPMIYAGYNADAMRM